MEDFIELLKIEDPRSIYRKHLLGHDVWYFSTFRAITEHAKMYDEMKIFMSDKLGIHVNNIAIVGSAKLGFSLAPDKKFRPFSSDSDIDIAIVSPEIYRKSWDAFIELSKKGYLPRYQSITSDVFRRFVTLKNPDPKNVFFREWEGKVEPCKKDLQMIFSIAHDINYRIYESWEAVEWYHCNGIEKLQNSLVDDKGK